MFRSGQFIGTSGRTLFGKIECDDLTKEDYNFIIEQTIRIIQNYRPNYVDFQEALPVPSGGNIFAEKLNNLSPKFRWKNDSNLILIVDDVYTTGKSINKIYNDSLIKYPKEKYEYLGIVIFNRSNNIPSWIQPIFSLNSILGVE